MQKMLNESADIIRFLKTDSELKQRMAIMKIDAVINAIETLTKIKDSTK
jgi:hypothetical protein